tara:strand:+ start:466 stop:696 length:231 start_codon:yes stop_codon:yes gene_type:complete
MNDWNPLVVKGQHVIQLLNAVSYETLVLIRAELGDTTFVNVDLIRIVEKSISNKRKKDSLEGLETVSVDEPEFWEE